MCYASVDICVLCVIMRHIRNSMIEQTSIEMRRMMCQLFKWHGVFCLEVECGNIIRVRKVSPFTYRSTMSEDDHEDLTAHEVATELAQVSWESAHD